MDLEELQKIIQEEQIRCEREIAEAAEARNSSNSLIVVDEYSKESEDVLENGLEHLQSNEFTESEDYKSIERSLAVTEAVMARFEKEMGSLRDQMNFFHQILDNDNLDGFLTGSSKPC